MPTNTITGFAPGDTLDLTGMAHNAADTVNYDSSHLTVTTATARLWPSSTPAVELVRSTAEAGQRRTRRHGYCRRIAGPPLVVADGVHRFAFDRPSAALWLASRRAVPADTDPGVEPRPPAGRQPAADHAARRRLTLDLAPTHPLLRDSFHRI
jgi:hypothetical protein